jgi:YVTN family beta-propeller protein
MLLLIVLAAAATCLIAVSSGAAAQSLPTPLASIAIPDFPQFLAVDPSSDRVYVDHAGSNEVSVIDAGNRTVIATIPLGDSVTGIAADPATHRVYVANFFNNAIAVIDEATNLVVGHIDVSAAAIGFGGGVPLGLAANADTHRVYVGLGGGSVAVIDETTDAVVGKIVTGGTPTGVAVNRITNRVYADDQDLGRVFVIDGTTNSLLTTVAVPQRSGGGDVSVSETANRVYTISADNTKISVIDGGTNTLVGTIDDFGVTATAFDEQANVLFVGNAAARTIDVYDGTTDALVGSVPVDAVPLYGLGVNPIAHELYSTAFTFTGSYALLVLGNADTTSPAISVPAPITANATSPSGAIVAYSVTASDPDDAVASLVCIPTSGSTFPIGTTTVDCTAADTHGNTSSASFTIHVKGAAEQLTDLLAAVSGVGPGTSLADKVRRAQTYLAANDLPHACSTLAALINEVSALSGNTIPSPQAATLIASAGRITAVLGC